MSLNQIARHAGVSIATVSRVINKNPSVRPATAQRVLRSIEQIRHTVPVTRDILSSHLSGRNGRVALALLGGLSFQRMKGVFCEVIAGVVAELQSLGLQMLVTEIGREVDVESAVRKLEADGAIVLGQASNEPGSAVDTFAQFLPSVWVMGPQIAPATVDHVIPHNLGIGEIAFRYLLERGCTRFTYVFQEVWSSRPNPVELMRAEAFSFAARMAGHSVEQFVPDDGPTANGSSNGSSNGLNHRIRSSEEIVDEFVARLVPGTGVFMATDCEMSRLYPALLSRGVRPEQDVMLIGCDNDAASLLPLNPKPATIDINLKEIGRQAVLRLLRRIRHPGEPPLVIELPPRLIRP